LTDNELRDRFAGFAAAGLAQAGAQHLLRDGASRADGIADLAETSYLIAAALMQRRKEVEDAESVQRAAHRAGPPAPPIAKP
jgi:hypothetical protein